MMSLWDALRMNMMISYQELVRTFLKQTEDALHLINIQVNQGIVDQMRAARDNAIAIAEAEKQASFLGGTRGIPG